MNGTMDNFQDIVFKMVVSSVAANLSFFCWDIFLRRAKDLFLQSNLKLQFQRDRDQFFLE